MVFKGCDCEAHQDTYSNWPHENAEIRVSTCMRRCPYCGYESDTATNVRLHLKTAQYRSRNLHVKREINGRAGVRTPSWRLLAPVHAHRPEPVHEIPNTAYDSDALYSVGKSILGKPEAHTPKSRKKRANVHAAEQVTVYNAQPAEIDHLKRQLQKLEGCGRDLSQLLAEGEFCTTEFMTLETRSLWEVSTTSVPTMFRSSGCWRTQPPIFEEFWLAVSRIPSKDARVFERGEQVANPNIDRVLCQLAQPNPENPTYVIGLEPPALLRASPFRTPTDLHKVITPHHEQRLIFNVTPKYSFVDLHIDYGMDGLSCPLGSCRKLWCMFPPTERNLDLMRGERSEHAKLFRVGHLMEGGFVCETTSDEALYIPAGCIHAVVTCEGGFLASLDFTTRDSIVPFGNYLAKALHLALDEESQRNCFFAYLQCLEVALFNQRVTEAVDSWLALEGVLKEFAAHHPSWRDVAAHCWQTFLEMEAPSSFHCPCGIERNLESFSDHLVATHLQFVFELDVSRRSRRRIF